MALDPAARRIVLAHRSQVATLRARIVRFIEATWGSFDSWRDADIDRFIRAVLPVVEGGQRTIANLTDAYLAAVISEISGEPTRPRGVARDAVTTEALRGVPAVAMWRRVGVTVWAALANGTPLPDAVAAAGARAVNLATTNLQLAKTHTARAVLDATPGVVGYRRVLEGQKSCGICAVASTQRYRSEDLMPIHGGCDCGVVPIIGDRDPGQVIDPDGLTGIQDELAERFGETGTSADDYRRFVVVHEHGEIGPVLGVRGQTFTGPTDL